MNECLTTPQHKNKWYFTERYIRNYKYILKYFTTVMKHEIVIL